MAGLKFSTFSQAARVSNLDIDADLDMGGRAVIAAKGRFNEVNLGKAVVTDTLFFPYTVTPSENVYFTANISMPPTLETNYKPLIGSIVIGPTIVPISPRLYFDLTRGATHRSQLRVHKNGEVIVTTDELTEGTFAIDLPDLIGGDVLSFSARADQVTTAVTFSNFRLAGDVVKHIIDEPTAETVYD